MMLRRTIAWVIIFSSLVFFAENAAAKTPSLSLNDAILLAIRENPNVQVAQLSHVQQKFALYIQHWQFMPHYSFTASETLSKTISSGVGQSSHATTISPGASLLTPIGTQLTLASTNPLNQNYNPGLTLQVIQPLLRGFGRPIVEAALNDAIDSEKISRLNVDNSLRLTVTSVINAYLDTIFAAYTVKIDQEALERAELSVKQTKLFISAGHKAGNEIVTVEADVANAQTRLENDKNELLQSRYALLSAIGIDPNTNVTISTLDIPALIKKYHIPTLAESQSMILANDIQYQTDQITFNGATKRSLLIAEDNTRWQLNLTLNGGVGQGSGGGANAGLNSLSNGNNRTESAQLNLVIPIDDELAKQGVMNAKIALRTAALALKQEKWGKQTSVINGWNSITSAQRALHFAEDAKRLQAQTYNLSYQKYLYGLIDSIALQSVQAQLVTTNQSLVSAQINYLKSLVNLDLLIGETLKTWDIHVRYF